MLIDIITVVECVKHFLVYRDGGVMRVSDIESAVVRAKQMCRRNHDTWWGEIMTRCGFASIYYQGHDNKCW